MQNAQEIYQAASQLPSEERLRLAAMILQDLTQSEEEKPEKKKMSAFDWLKQTHRRRLFKTSDEVDKYLREERDSWER